MKNDDKKKVEEVKEEFAEDLKKESCHCEDCDCKKEGNETEDALAEVESKYRRALADYQNLQKRTQDERREWILSAGRDVLLRMLPVLDTLTMASKHTEDQTIKVTLQQFLDVLKSEGVVKIDAVGKKFDPHLMECVEKVDDGDDVLEEVRVGYMLHDKLLRVAEVKVGKK